jgi:hypothetical protein
MVGGGYNVVNSNEVVNIFESAPASTTTWTVRARGVNNTTATNSFRAWVACGHS